MLVRRTESGDLKVGTVVGARGKARTFQVRWPDGQEERVRLDAATDRFAAEGSALLEWLVDPAALAKRFEQDAVGVFADLIRDGNAGTNAGVTMAAMKKTLTGLGLAEADVKKAWTASLPKLKQHKHIVVTAAKYAWTETPRDPYAQLRAQGPQKAFDRLLKGGRIPADEKQVLIEVVRAELSGGGIAGDGRTEAIRANELRTAQDQKVRAQGVQAFAELAMELEELVVNGAGADILIERVRRGAGTQGLTPIGSAGQTASFDRSKHSPIVGSPKDGTRVTVVRPGYSWRTAKEDVLVAKALVIEQ